MKKYIFIFSTVLFFAACSNNKDDQDETEVLEKETEILLWQSTENDSGRLELTRNRPVVTDSLAPEVVITYLNSQYPRVQLKLDRVSNDTLYVSIPDAMFLTQQMGSSGPVIYFADAIYNLTEIPGIRYINFNFEEGDHAAPSVESRESLMKEFRPFIKDSIIRRDINFLTPGNEGREPVNTL